MTFLVKGRKKHQSVVFKKRGMDDKNSSSASSHNGSRPSLVHDHKTTQRFEDLTDDSPVDEYSSEKGFFVYRPSSNRSMMAATTTYGSVPNLFTNLPLLHDLLVTETSIVQDETIQECFPFLSGTEPGINYNGSGVPHLDRKRHVQFLHKSLRKLPAPYVAADASRPWMFYWAIAALATMGEDVSQYREKLIATVRPIQNATGGFGGGNGQMSHLAPTYAIILALAMVGGKDALDVIDRKAMWKWLGALKQPDGGIQMSVGGEVDVRGVYCAAVAVTLLNLPLDLSRESPGWSREGDTLFTHLPEWLARCQSFEGGISSRPDAEAHGAYAFCALACLCILGDPHIMIPKYLDLPQLTSWLSARQYAPEGGLAGRTNKLVDGCYSHWVGGCWPLLQAALDGPSHIAPGSSSNTTAKPSVGSLYSREGLIRYILCCCQDQTKRGGLRDKPSHNSDAYHTCYVLAGLSSAQHKWNYGASVTKGEETGILDAAFKWSSEPIIEEAQIFDEEDRVNTLHPVFVIPEGIAEEVRAYFAAKGGF